jgi:uncharacterized SAM-binding protein YcdF (DUF218 family)
MAQNLPKDLQVPASWIEPRAQETWENSNAILKANGVRSVYLVTSTWHIRRAIVALAHFRITVTGVPVRIDRSPMVRLSKFYPERLGYELLRYARGIGCANCVLR